jgi:hypothetical protein
VLSTRDLPVHLKFMNGQAWHGPCSFNRMARTAAFGFVALLAFGGSTAAFAQQTNEPRTEPKKEDPAPQAERRSTARQGLIDRSRGIWTDLRARGIRPHFGTLGAGSGFAIGAEIRRESFFAPDVGVSLAGSVSVRGYQAYDARLGRVTDWSSRTELRPADADPTGAISIDGHPVPGFSAYVHTRQRVARRLDYFGMNGDARLEDRADYGLAGLSTDAVVQWQLSPKLGLAARAGWMRLELGPGSNTRVPNLEERFAVSALPGMAERSSYFTLGAGVVRDSRNDPEVPTRGYAVSATAWRYLPVKSGTSFGRVAFDARGYQSLVNDRHVLAARLLVIRTSGHVEDVPFYLQGTLGGSRTLRGVRNFRLRGPAIAHATFEYRWHAFKRFEIVPFVDAGFAAASFTGVPREDIVVTPGIGFRFRTSSSVIGRLDVAWGPDGRRLLLAVGSPF